MRISIAGVGAFCAALLVAGPALADVTITNQDTKTHTIVINNGKSASSKDIAAGKSVTVPCPQDCGFRDLAQGFSRTAGGNAKLVIDTSGELHFVGGHGDEVMPNGKS